MPTIAANTYRLPILDKLERGQTILTLSTDNPEVPGNGPAVARLAAAQAALEAASLAYNDIQNEARMLLAKRDAAAAEWNAAVQSLAIFTESATGSSPVKIMSAGFAIRAPKTPPQPVGPVEEVSVAYGDRPGYSDLAWKPQPGAVIYRIQCCTAAQPVGPWMESGNSTAARFTANGATPGQPCWYRIAAINSLGQGPWSGPTQRPLM